MGKDFIVSNAENERDGNNQNGILNSSSKTVTFSCRVGEITRPPNVAGFYWPFPLRPLWHLRLGLAV
jgi:hypothetical protein